MSELLEEAPRMGAKQDHGGQLELALERKSSLTQKPVCASHYAMNAPT